MACFNVVPLPSKSMHFNKEVRHTSPPPQLRSESTAPQPKSAPRSPCHRRRQSIKLFSCFRAQSQCVSSPERQNKSEIKTQSHEVSSTRAPSQQMSSKKGSSKENSHIQDEPPVANKVPVTLNVYHASANENVQHINSLLKHIGTGIFHAGVVIYGREWSYSHKREFRPHNELCDPCNPESGISCCPPQKHPGHVYQESVALGEIDLTASQVHSIIKRMASEWRGKDYDLLTKNCCHFCCAFCQALGVSAVPSQIMSLAGAGAKLRDGMRNVAYPLKALALHLEALAAKDVSCETAQVEATVQNMRGKTEEQTDAIEA